MAEQALEDGMIRVYSSKPIENGVFVTPSRKEAESYSADGKVYSKSVPLNAVAWIDPTQGQYAPVAKNENDSYNITTNRNEAERRRALRKGEMLNEFHGKINWTLYYQKILSDEYRSEYFDDGDTAQMELENSILTLQRQNNGERSVIKMEELNDERTERKGTKKSGGNGKQEISKQRKNYSDLGSKKSDEHRSSTGERSAGTGKRGDTERDGKVRTTDASVEQTEEVNRQYSYSPAQEADQLEDRFLQSLNRDRFEAETENAKKLQEDIERDHARGVDKPRQIC